MGTHIYNVKQDGTLRFGRNTSDISVTSTGLTSGENNVLIRKDLSLSLLILKIEDIVSLIMQRRFLEAQTYKIFHLA